MKTCIAILETHDYVWETRKKKLFIKKLKTDFVNINKYKDIFCKNRRFYICAYYSSFSI